MSTFPISESSVHAAPPGVAVLVTAYEPGRMLLDVVEPLICAGTPAIIVVDDGSSSAREWLLNRLALEPTVHLVRHSAPKGRGAALKTGIQYFLEHLRHYTGLVTTSVDGQYAAEDVLRLARALRRSPKLAIVAAREFPEGGSAAMAWRSGLGLTDRVLRMLFRVCTGIAISDIQTRLRALPTGVLPRLLRIPGNRFDYELAMLLHLARSGYPLAEHAVPGRLDSRSADPEFRPVSDSVSMLRAVLNCKPVDPFTLEHATQDAVRQADGDSSRFGRSSAKQTR